MIQRLFLPLILGAALYAQPPDLKTVLNLSDSQVVNLIQLQQQKGQALQPLAQQVAARQQKIQQMLEAGPDPAAVGQLFIEITVISKQIQEVSANFQQQAMAVLSADQRTQVQSLAPVLKLQVAAQQAVGLGLLNPPN